MNIEILKEFFMWNTVIHLGLFIWTGLMCTCCKSFIYRAHGKMFGLGEEAIDAFLYGFLALYKIVFLVFVLVPWFALMIIS